MMKLVTTIPRKKFKTEADCLAALSASNGSRRGGYWLINTNHLPKNKDSICEGICFMVFGGRVLGYMNMVDYGYSEDWRKLHNIGKTRTTQSIVMANFHPLNRTEYMTGFQGWRYTYLEP